LSILFTFIAEDFFAVIIVKATEGGQINSGRIKNLQKF
jgi:hypothetical protein